MKILAPITTRFVIRIMMAALSALNFTFIKKADYKITVRMNKYKFISAPNYAKKSIYLYSYYITF